MPTWKKKIVKKKKKKRVKRLLRKESNISVIPSKITIPIAIEEKLEQPECTAELQKINNSDCDIAGVKRLFSHFSKFDKPRSSEKPKVMTEIYEGVYKKQGLSPKEKSYLICSCQTRSTRYTRLKALANEAIKHKKIFLIHGFCNPLRDTLVERGWVEKIPPNRMTLDKLRNQKFTNNNEIHKELEKLLLSNFVEKYQPNFIWNAKDDICEDNPGRNNNVIYNKLRVDAQWTTKQGLCASSRNGYWYYIEDVAEVNTPRTYTTFDDGEKDEFEADYKLTACTSLLKWVLSMVANDRPIFSESGNIAINVIVFALNRCKEYLFHKQNKDIDKLNASTATSGQWNAFFKKYYILIAKEDTFKMDKENKIPLYLGYAKFLLKEIHKYRPQLSCEGCHNIWIIKPAHCSRGRGIRMASKFGVLSNLLNRGKYVFQKYIEEPLLLHETKFDIRQYYLISNTYPLVIWMYKDCYLKFSSQKYSLKNYHESIHLTNNAVQKKYKNCTGRHPELPPHNMWDLETYKQYLQKIGKEHIWDTVIYPGMKKSIIGIMLSCQESVTYSKNRFELYGCDFILDKDYRPWLIEINSCPDLNPTTQVTAKICPAVLSDIIKVVVDRAADSKASTGNFECIYRQTICMPRYGTAADLTVRGYALPNDYFYRGSFTADDSYDDPKIGKQQDVTAMLQKLKLMYESDIMVKPEDDREVKLSKDTKKVKPLDENTKSEQDLSEVATVIAGQLDDLLDRITSNYSPSIKKNDSSISSPSSINIRKSLFQGVETKEGDIKSLLNLSISKLSDTNINNKFNFSKLDDGPGGKGSGTVSHSSHEARRRASKVNEADTSEDLVLKSSPRSNKPEVMQHESQEETIGFNITEATRKMFYFLQQKQNEYSKDLNK